MVYLDSGRGGAGVAIDPTGSGDVTARIASGNSSMCRRGFSSPVIVGEYLYRLCNSGDAALLETRRRRGSVPGTLARCVHGVSPFTTPEGRIYLASAGKSYVLKAGPKREILAVNDLADGSQSSPAVADGCIFLKGRRQLYCIGNK